jgi:hypothetical protein
MVHIRVSPNRPAASSTRLTFTPHSVPVPTNPNLILIPKTAIITVVHIVVIIVLYPTNTSQLSPQHPSPVNVSTTCRLPSFLLLQSSSSSASSEENPLESRS